MRCLPGVGALWSRSHRCCRRTSLSAHLAIPHRQAHVVSKKQPPKVLARADKGFEFWSAAGRPSLCSPAHGKSQGPGLQPFHRRPKAVNLLDGIHRADHKFGHAPGAGLPLLPGLLVHAELRRGSLDGPLPALAPGA